MCSCAVDKTLKFNCKPFCLSVCLGLWNQLTKEIYRQLSWRYDRQQTMALNKGTCESSGGMPDWKRETSEYNTALLRQPWHSMAATQRHVNKLWVLFAQSIKMLLSQLQRDRPNSLVTLHHFNLKFPYSGRLCGITLCFKSHWRLSAVVQLTSVIDCWWDHRWIVGSLMRNLLSRYRPLGNQHRAEQALYLKKTFFFYNCQ